MAMTHPNRHTLWHLAQRYPLRPEVWDLHYRTACGERAHARIHLHQHELLAQVRKSGQLHELRDRDPLTLGKALDPHPDAITAPFRRVR